MDANWKSYKDENYKKCTCTVQARVHVDITMYTRKHFTLYMYTVRVQYSNTLITLECTSKRLRDF